MARPLHVFLVNANHDHEFDGGPVENLGLGYLASYLRQDGFAVTVIDALMEGLSPPEVASAVRRPGGRSLLGFTSMGYRCVVRAGEVLDRLGPGSGVEHVVLGGPFPTFAYRRILGEFDRFDSIVRFEGELPLLDLARCVEAGRVWQDVPGLAFRDEEGRIRATGRPAVLPDLDRLPFPSRETTGRVIQLGGGPHLLSSRGCPGRCLYCMTTHFFKGGQGPAWRARSPRNVVDEVEALVARGARKIVFLDETFVGETEESRSRARAIGEEIRARGLVIAFSIYCRPGEVDRDLFAGLQVAGLGSVYLGVESFRQETLDLWKKDQSVDQILAALAVIRELGLELQLGLILFHPLATFDELRHNLSAIEANILGMRIAGPQLVDRLSQDLLVFHGSVIRGYLARLGLLGELRLVDGEMLLYRTEVDPRVALYLEALRYTIRPLRDTYRVLYRRVREGATPPEEILALDRNVLSYARRLLDHIEANGVTERSGLEDLLREMRSEIGGYAAVVELRVF